MMQHKSRDKSTIVTKRDEKIIVKRKNFLLEVMEGPDKGRRLVTSKVPLLLGAADNCDFRMVDDAVSGNHCQIDSINNRYILIDLYSRNGTYLNEVEVNQAFLDNASKIRVGTNIISFVVQSSTTEIPISQDTCFGKMCAKSLKMREIFALAEGIARTDANILIMGERGSGKRTLARSIHDTSKRCDYPFVSVDCSSFSEVLLERELFGFEAGAFPGAATSRKGLIESAENGTLFLKGVGDLGLKLQKGLQRLLKTGLIYRAGSDKPVTVNVRLISATHKDMPKLIKRGRFIDALYYQINTLNINLPSLQDRKDDIPVLANLFYRELCGSDQVKLPPEILQQYISDPWTGNVKELKRQVKKFFVSSRSKSTADFRIKSHIHDMENHFLDDVLEIRNSFTTARNEFNRLFERIYLKKLMSKNDFNVRMAAEFAGMELETLQKLLEEHRLYRVATLDGDGEV